VREAFRASPEIYVLGSPLVGEDRKISYEIGDLQAGVPGSVLLTLVLPPRKPGMVRILQSSFHYEVPGSGEATAKCDLAVDYTLDRTLTSKRNGRVMNLVDQVSIAKMQSRAEEELKAGNVDRATRLLSNAIQGTQRLGNVKATQALVGLMNEVKKTQTLQTKAAKTTLLQAQAVVREGVSRKVRVGVTGLALQSTVEFGLYVPALAWPQFLFLGWLWSAPSCRAD
jgi:hypothetical protein